MIKIICIGKIKEKYLTEGINDYLKRINKYHKLEIIECKDSNIESEALEIKKKVALSGARLMLIKQKGDYFCI